MSDDNHECLAERDAEMPLALILADNLEKQVLIGEAKYYLDGDAADELRRLHTQHQADQERIKELETLNKELVDALKAAYPSVLRDPTGYKSGTIRLCEDAINKAGESNE